MSKPIAAWSEKDLYEWYGRYQDPGWRMADPRKWRVWSDDRRHDEEDPELEQKLERWCVRCPLCLLYRDTRCNGHKMSDCGRPEQKLACYIEDRLGHALEEIEQKGLGGYGEVPWCSTCCLPRSRCHDWERGNGEGEQPGDDKQWRRVTTGMCHHFRGVVIRAVSAMLSFALPSGATLLQQVGVWQEESQTCFNGGLDMGGLRPGGWLLSPMWWGGRQVMIMLRVFYQLDMAVEEVWLLKAIERRQVELNALGPQQWNDIESVANCNNGTPQRKWLGTEVAATRTKRYMALMDEENPWAGTAALRHAEEHLVQSSGYGKDYWCPVKGMIRKWGERGIRCQLCRTHEWSENAYEHSAGSCSRRPESRAFKILVERLSSLEGNNTGNARSKTCQTCKFPLPVCQPVSPGDRPWSTNGSEAEWGRCRGTEVMKQTVAALLVIAGGKLGELVIDEEMGPWMRQSGEWNNMIEGWKKGEIGYEGLPDEWMREQVSYGGHRQPRLVRMFVQLAGAYEML